MTATWMEDAACRGIDTELFFPPAGSQGSAARRICDRCPVKTDCENFAAVNQERFGIWGGKSAEDRYRRQRRKAASE